MAEQAAKTRAEAIEGFAEVLRDLRESVGNPAFREMSGRSRAISHTTLHEAAQGNRLPSWSTTVEFVKACGADPAAYRERWEHANKVIRSVTSLRLSAPASDPASRSIAAGLTDRSAIHFAIRREPAPKRPSSDAPASGRPPAPSASGDGEAPDPAPRKGRRLRFVLPGVAAVGAVAAAVTIAVIAASQGTNSSGGKRNGTALPPHQPLLSPAACPIHPSNPPPATPAHAGDVSAFVADITLPDCTHIHRGQTVTKVWRLKNIGKVPWTGYSLHRLDQPQQRNQCQTISDVPIDDTPPGHLVDIRTEITAPLSPGFCFVRFKMMDAAGNMAFPGSRPVNFQLIVD